MRKWPSLLGVSLIAALAGDSFADTATLTRVAGIRELKCKINAMTDKESCSINSELQSKHVGGRRHVYIVALSLPEFHLAFVTEYASKSQIRIDRNQVSTTGCNTNLCVFAESKRLIKEMTSGRSLQVRILKGSGIIEDSVSLNGFLQLYAQAVQKLALKAATAQKKTASSTEALHPNEILELQTLLKRHGYEPGKPDGVAGKKTRKAITAYQIDNDIQVDGKPTRSLLERLQL